MLAEHFLSDYPDAVTDDVRDLADEIQGAVEDWLGWNKPRLSGEPLPTTADVRGIMKPDHK
jgi:hypothetical protein